MPSTASNTQCSSCLYDTAHPFGLSLLSDGECSGCQTHKEKDSLNWSEHLDKLKQILSLGTKGHKGSYDCVVPIQGDAEDYYVVTLVHELGLNPLLVCVNDYFQNDIGWHNLHNLITHFDADSLVYNPELDTYKELVRTSLRKLNHLLWPSLALKSSFPVHIAKQRKIPFVIWGQLQAVEQVGKFSHLDEARMSKWSRCEHDILRSEVDSFIGTGAQVLTQKLNYYRYPDIQKLGEGQVQGLYLSNYFRWDPLYQNRLSVNQGFVAEKNIASFDVYERAGSSVYYNFHDLLKYKRVGYRKVLDHLTREIRHGRISLNQATKLKALYQSTKVDIDGFFNWLGVTKSGRDWFVLKRLNDVEHLIGAPETTEIEIPEDISRLLVAGTESTRDYLPFAKGVYL